MMSPLPGRVDGSPGQLSGSWSLTQSGS
jgi:hypothetical protein